MKAWLKKNHILMKLLSVALSVTLWIYVIYQDNPERTVTISDIPVRLLNTESLRRVYGMVVTNERTPTVTVKLSGTFNRLEGVTADDIRVTADVYKLTEPGSYTISYDIYALDGITVIERSPDIKIEIDEQITLELPVEVSIVGEIPEGLQADMAIADPTTVSVTGVRSKIENAASVCVTVNGAELTKPFSDDLEYTLLDAEGQKITADFESNAERVHIEIPVYRVKEIPLRVNVLYGNGATEENTNIRLSQQQIEVIGDIDAVTALDEIVLGTVDTTAFTETLHQEYTVELPAGVKLKRGSPNVAVDVEFQNLVTRQIVVTDIRIQNVQEQYQAVSDTQEVKVTVRGRPELLDSLVSGDIAVLADLTDVSLISGMQRVPAQVLLSDRVSEIGIFGEYFITVRAEYMNPAPPSE